MQTITVHSDTSNQNRNGHRTGIKNIEKWKKDILAKWVVENKANPYPSEDVKENLAKICRLTKKQVSNWFTNARKVRERSAYFVSPTPVQR